MKLKTLPTAKMAELPDTLRLQRKRILSSTPPNAKKNKEKTKEGEEHMTVSPKVTQDLKKRIVEVDEDGNIKSNGESVVAGTDRA